MSSVAFNIEGDVLAVSSQRDEIRLIDVESREIVRTLNEPRRHVTALAWSPDGALAEAENNRMDLWSDHKIGNSTPRAAARTDDGDVTECLNRIHTKIANRGLKMNPPAELDEVNAFEVEHGVTLPEGFRRFITEIGNGGEEPPHII